MKQFFCFWKNEFKMAASKKPHFPAPPILNIFSWKFHGLVLELIKFIDAKGIGVAQPIWSWGCPKKQPKNTKKCIFCLFEPHQCPSHQSILLTQGKSIKFSWKNIEIWKKNYKDSADFWHRKLGLTIRILQYLTFNTKPNQTKYLKSFYVHLQRPLTLFTHH